MYGPNDEERLAAVSSEWEQAGFLRDDGTRDLSKFRAAVLEHIMKAKVIKKEERIKKACTRGDLTKKVFPDIIAPPFTDADDVIMANRVWDEIDKYLWQQTGTGSKSALQRMVGVHMGNGYVLCRTKVGNDKVDAVYVTDNYALIKEDFVRPENLSLQRRNMTAVQNREMIMIRHPKQARDILNEYVRTLQAALDTGKAQLSLMEGSVAQDINNNGHNDDDEESED